MGYCPKCGAAVYSDETFCVNCGDKLPNNLADRLFIKQWSFKYFLLPIVLVILIIGLSAIIYTIYSIKINDATAAYYQAEEALLLSDYQLADEYVSNAIEIYPHFEQAKQLKQFTQFSVNTLADLTELESNQDKLQLILQAKNELMNYQGEAVNIFQQQLLTKQKNLQIEMVRNKLAEDPKIEDLPLLLWEADSIQDPEAYQLVKQIRDQLITHTTNQAYSYLNQNQFSLAKRIVENGLYYVPNDLKLTSLLNSIMKEQESFIAAQEARLEQAFSQYEVEQEMNENDAIDDLVIEFKINSEQQLVVSGELTSVATVPIHAVLIHYVLIDQDGEELETNDIYVYPETLYPGESGQFDHIHFEKNLIEETVDIQVTTVTWLLN
ncbi:MAG TPA: zinc ribbon domain-containing protein [Bacilli bacterium]|nr:zinc ribbon domain-containing protein [Bacilli bacterium]